MMKCDKSTDEAERYVSGVQSEAEQAAFEEHFFACEDCLLRVQALQDAVAVLSAERAGANAGPMPFPGPRVRTLPVKWMALAAMIVLSVLVWRLPREAARPAVEVASSPPQPAITVAPKPAASEPQPPGAPAPNSDTGVSQAEGGGHTFRCGVRNHATALRFTDHARGERRRCEEF